MAKKRKTREQKKLADLRHTFRHAFVEQINSAAKNTAQISDRFVAKPVGINTPIRLPIKSNQQTAINQYPFLIKDLSKTGLLTLTILLFQIILFTLLKNHLVTIPGIGY